MHGCKKKSRGCLNRVFGDYFLAELNALSFFLRGRLSGFDSRLRAQIFFCIHVQSYRYFEWEKKKQIKKQILQFGRPPDELSSQHVFCSEQPNPHHLFPDLRVCLSFVLQAFFLIFILFFLKTNIT